MPTADPPVVMPLATPAEPSLSHQTARGFAWMAGQSLATKVVTTVGQVVLAWFLLPEDFGLAAVAYMLSVVPVLIQQGGVKEVLIRRYQRFHRWANAAFWISMTLGLAGGAIMAGIAPFAADWYNEPRLLGLTLVIAVLFPLDSLIIVPLASIYGQMRFRFAAALGMGQATMQTTLAVVFAAWGWGAYSLILPRLFVAAGSAIVCWWLAPPPVRLNPQFRRWKLLIGDGGLVIAANACDLALTYGGYLILSVMFGFESVGLYFFAFTLSLQTFALITASLSGVLYPALNTLHEEPQRQAAAFLRATRTLAVAMFAACFLQAALTDPGIRLVFDKKWIEAIPLLQALSIGMAMRGIGAPAVALFQAQNRFSTRLAMSVISLLVFAVLAGLGAWWDGAPGMALGVAAHMLIIEPINVCVAIRHGGKSPADFGRVLAGPLLVGALTVGPAWLLGHFFQRGAAEPWLRLCIITIASASLFFPAVRFLTPDVWMEARHRIRGLLASKAR